MDKISVVGLLVGLLAIVGGLALEGGHVGSLLQPTAFVIVIGGTLGAVMLQSPLPVFLSGMRMVRWVIQPPPSMQAELLARITGWAYMARREGLLSLEAQIHHLDDTFMAKGMQLLVDGAEPERLREVLDTDIYAFESRLRQGARIWEAAGGYAPTVGILGAVMGLIHVMENLSDPSKLGSGIAVAFVATIYGVGFANLVFLPVARKLFAQVHHMVREREMVVDGLVAIANGDNPRIIENRLQGYFG